MTYFTLSQMDVEIIKEYFTVFGSILAIVLSIIKIREYFSQGPKIRIDFQAPQFYVEDNKDRITFDFTLEIINVGKIPIQLKDIQFRILDKKKHHLDKLVFIESFHYYLEPYKHITIPILRETISEKNYSDTLWVEIEVQSTIKKWVKKVEFLSIEAVQALFKKEDKSKTVYQIEGTIEEIKKVTYKDKTK